MKNKKTKILINPYDLEITNTQQGFKLTLRGRTDNGNGNHHEIVFEFEQWWIKYFLKDLRNIIDLKRAELDKYEKSFNQPQQIQQK